VSRKILTILRNLYHIVVKREIIIKPSRGINWRALKEIKHYKDLLFFFIWKEFKVRYKQTLLGVAWAILRPVIQMLIFTLIFHKFAKIPSEGIPYPVYAYCGLLPWQLFSLGLGRASESVVGNASIITKVYFPRIILPLSYTLGGLIDFGLQFFVLIILMLIFGIKIGLSILFIPFFIILALLSSLSVGILFSALNVKFRDIRHLMPFLTQVWFFATPIVYSHEIIPEKFRLIMRINPMTGVVEGFRWSLLNKGSVDFQAILFSVIIVSFLIFAGLLYFSKVEREFADIV